MIEDRIQRLAQEIADSEKLHNFKLHPARLSVAIRNAVDEHNADRLLHEHRDGAAAVAPELRRVASLVGRALTAWREAPLESRRLALEFVDGASETDHIGERLIFVEELLSELHEHYRREVGNPGKSRADSGVDLHPLEGFVSVLMDFWTSETGGPAGHKIDTADDLDPAVRDAVSPFMTLLMDAGAGALSPSPYTAGNYETVVRRLKRERQST